MEFIKPRPGDKLIIFCPSCHMITFDPKICLYCGKEIPPTARVKLLRKNKQIVDLTGITEKNFPKHTFYPRLLNGLSTPPQQVGPSCEVCEAKKKVSKALQAKKKYCWPDFFKPKEEIERLRLERCDRIEAERKRKEEERLKLPTKTVETIKKCSIPCTKDPEQNMAVEALPPGMGSSCTNNGFPWTYVMCEEGMVVDRGLNNDSKTNNVSAESDSLYSREKRSQARLTLESCLEKEGRPARHGSGAEYII